MKISTHDFRRFWNPVAETLAHKLDPFLPVAEILLLRLGGTKPPRLFLVGSDNDGLLADNVLEVDDAVNDDPLFEEESPAKTTCPNDTALDDRERRLVSLPPPKKLVFRFLDCPLRLIAIDKQLEPIGSEFSFSPLVKDKLELVVLPKVDDEIWRIVFPRMV